MGQTVKANIHSGQNCKQKSLFFLLSSVLQRAVGPSSHAGQFGCRIAGTCCGGGGAVRAAYASQETCSQTCNLQIINVVLISHINSCHFVGMVFTPSSRSLGPVPATSASETARVITLLQSESGVSEERKVAGWFTRAHRRSHTHAHTHSIAPYKVCYERHSMLQFLSD